MAIQPLQIPYANINNAADFTPLANLGNVYREAQNRQKLSDLGKQLASGSIDYRNAAGQLADMGDIGSTLKFLALDEQQKQKAREEAASTGFATNVGSIFNPPNAARTIAAPPSVGVNPAAGVAPNAAEDDETALPPPARPVPSTPSVVGTNEGIAKGLYPPAPPTGGPPTPGAPPPVAPPAAPAAPSFDDRFGAARPQGVASSDVTGPTLAHVPMLLQAITNPNLPQAQKDVAKDFLKRALDGAQPGERMKFLTDLSEASNFKGTPLELEMMLRKSGATNIDQRTESAFAKTGGEVLAKRFGKISELGDQATVDQALLGRLTDLRQTFQTGGPAALQGWLADQGIKVGKNVGQVEAYNEIIKKLTPEQRVPGSGSTSDYEDKLFQSALPKLINSPGGNDVIDKTLNALNQHKMERARIAELALSGEISPKDATKQLQDLSDPNSSKNPYNMFKAYAKAGFKPDQNAAPAAVPPAAAAAATPQAQPQAKFTPDEVSQSIANAKAKIAVHPETRDAVIQRLKANGIDTGGL